MSRSAPNPRPAAWPWLAPLICLVASATASGSTCHAPERPALDFAIGAEARPTDRQGPTLDVASTGTQFRPSPCPSEQPGPSRRPAPLPDLGPCPTAPAFAPPEPPAWPRSADPGGPLANPSPIERPPRDRIVPDRA